MNTHEQPTHISPFWTDPDTVDRFANREPDRRLVVLLGEYANPPTTRVLDLGCAGGRNTELLESKGFDFNAVDASMPMVARTRERIKARKRVSIATMEDLGVFADDTFDLIVALGVYHQAATAHQWHNAVAESTRVIKDGGLVLVSSFAPDSQPEGRPLNPMPGSDGVFEGFSAGPVFLLGKENHDREMAKHGFEPQVPTETVRVETELGFRITMNALYRRCE